MAVILNPYLSFRDTTREAMEFYRSVLGGDLTITTFAENDMAEDPSDADKVMHSQLDTPLGITLMASDTPNSMDLRPGNTFAVCLSGTEGTSATDAAPLDGYWAGLADGATITMPFEEAPWGGRFGMLTDRFGIDWMVSAP